MHFRYLEADEFGLLHVGRTWDEHAAQLEASLRGEGDDGRNERFLRRFVRPLGLDRPATPLLADAIEELGARPAPAPEREPDVRAARPPARRAARGRRREAGEGARAEPRRGAAANDRPARARRCADPRGALDRRRDRRAPLLDPVPPLGPDREHRPAGAALRAARAAARGLVRGDRRRHRSARRREATRPGARAGRSLRARPPGPRPAHPAPSARVRAAPRGRPVRRPVRRRGLPRRARRAAGQGDRRRERRPGRPADRRDLPRAAAVRAARGRPAPRRLGAPDRARGVRGAGGDEDEPAGAGA